MKKVISLAVAAILLLTVAVSASAEHSLGLGSMFVYTENGKGLNVRSSPNAGDNIIGSLKYGAKVNVTGFDGAWASIDWKGSTAYVQSRFLQWYAPDPKPAPKPAPTPQPDPEAAELRSEVPIASVQLQVLAPRNTGWANMRVGPSKNTRRVEHCADGTELTAFGATTNWYHVTNPVTGNSGYIRQDYLRIVPVPQPVIDEETQIGTLNVNGAFQLKGKIPEGYKLNVISGRGSKVIASLNSDDTSRPSMMLTVAFNEMYADVKRMNDMSAEEIENVKASYSSMNDVVFSEAETAAGTKLLIVKEAGEDEDFVSIFSVYEGYAVEFLLAPNPRAANAVLTDAQIQTAIDFLSNLEFIPAN